MTQQYLQDLEMISGFLINRLKRVITVNGSLTLQIEDIIVGSVGIYSVRNAHLNEK